MKKARWVSAAAGAALLAAGLALPASAASAAVTDGNGNGGVLSIFSGNTVNAPVSLPVNVCGVAVTLLGGANAGCAGGASSTTVIGGGGSGGSGGSGNGNAGVASIGSGNTVSAPVSAPVNLCGVSRRRRRLANSGCQGGSNSTTVVGSGGSGSGSGNGGVASVLSGNTVNAPVSAPVNVCGLSLALLGLANSGCEGGACTTTVVGNGGGNGNGNSGGVACCPATPSTPRSVRRSTSAASRSGYSASLTPAAPAAPPPPPPTRLRRRPGTTRTRARPTEPPPPGPPRRGPRPRRRPTAAASLRLAATTRPVGTFLRPAVTVRPPRRCPVGCPSPVRTSSACWWPRSSASASAPPW